MGRTAERDPCQLGTLVISLDKCQEDFRQTAKPLVLHLISNSVTFCRRRDESLVSFNFIKSQQNCPVNFYLGEVRGSLYAVRLYAQFLKNYLR